MANRTLLATTCTQKPDGSYGQANTYYDPARRAAQLSPLVTEETAAFVCTPYQIAAGIVLESYCAVNANGDGVLRTATSNGGNGVVQLFTLTDTVSAQCSTACDLAITTQQAFPVSAPGQQNGRLVIEANTTHPYGGNNPITCYVPGLGYPTSVNIFNANLPRLVQFLYEQVPPGSYAATLQDANNCRANTGNLVVGTGSPSVGGTVKWFWFDYKDNGQNLPQLTGHAWDDTDKFQYPLTVNLNIPVWYQNTQQYDQGTLVLSSYYGDWRIFRAARDVIADSKRHQVTMPSVDSIRDGDWEPVLDGYHYEIDGGQFRVLPFFADTVTVATFANYYEGSIVRYGRQFFRSKRELRNTAWNGRKLPRPKASLSTDYWEYLPHYTDYSYLIPESQAIDTYPNGTATRRVSYHAANPDLPGFVPTATVVVPTPYTDEYVLLNDTENDAESERGDLVLIDVVKTDIDDAGAENGSIRIDAFSPSLPLQFHLVNGVRPGYVQDITHDSTAIYENLYAGHYQVYIKDADGRQLVIDLDLEDRYRPRWQLNFDDLARTPQEKNSLLSLTIYQRDWTGDVSQDISGPEPVILSWDSGTDPAGNLPQVLGAELKFSLRTQVVQQFAETAAEDNRFHRVDLRRGDLVLFSGYIDATSYSEKLLGPGQFVELAATDGLGALRYVPFTNFYLERQTGRTSILSIVLKLLSFCDLNLPLHCGINLREQLMAADADPLDAAWVYRQAYNKKDSKYLLYGDFVDCRTVLDYILSLFHAQLYQAEGAWHIVGINEVHELDTAVRVWSPAGTLRTGIDTKMLPLRVLPPEQAMGDREMYWIQAAQVRNTYPSASEVFAIAALKPETSLFDNGDFVRWNGSRPTSWATVGGIAVDKSYGEEEGEFSVQFSGYTTALTPGNYLISPGAPHLPGADENYMRLTLRAIVDLATNNPAPSTLTLYVQVVCDGVPYLDPIPVPMSSTTDKKWKDYAIDLPLGMPGKQVRVRLLEPVLNVGAPLSSLRLNSAALAIHPGLFSWPETRYEKAENPGINTGLPLPDVEVINCDVPQLAALNSNPQPIKGMDVYALRSAITLADNTGTTGWKLPGYPSYTPLLHNIAQGRLVLRYAPTPVLVGMVTGPGVRHLHVGMMLDAPADVQGKYYLTDVELNLRSNTASVTFRLLADGYYDGAVFALPDNALVAKKRGRLGYRTAKVNGQIGYRIVHV